MTSPVYSLVVPIYNEEAVLPLLLRRLDALLDSLDGPAEAIFVDDGSKDTSPIVCEAKARAEAGTGTQLDVLNSETALTQARTTQVLALHDYVAARARLERAIGADLAPLK